MPAFVVRDDHLKRFRRQTGEDLSRAIRNHLETHCEELIRGVGQVELAVGIQTGIERALSLGLNRKFAVAVFVELMFLIGPGFERHPPIARVLSRPEGTPDERLLLLMDSLTEAQWQSARRRHHSNARD